MNRKIHEVWAFVCLDDGLGDGDEGIPAMSANGMAMPLIASDQARLESLKEMLKTIQEHTGVRPMELRRFTLSERITDWENYEIK